MPTNLDGFLTVLTAPGDPGAATDYAGYAGSHALAVDGIHASMETEVTSVIGVASYKHAATVYQSGSGESGSEALKRRSMMCMASPFVPAAVSNISERQYLSRGRYERRRGYAGGFCGGCLADT